MKLEHIPNTEAKRRVEVGYQRAISHPHGFYTTMGRLWAIIATNREMLVQKHGRATIDEIEKNFEKLMGTLL